MSSFRLGKRIQVTLDQEGLKVDVYKKKPGFCGRCGKEIKFIDRLQYNPTTGRCGACEAAARQSLGRFRQAFLAYGHDGVFSHDEWQKLVQGNEREGISMEEALAFVRGDAIQILERMLTIASADGAITEQEERDFIQIQTQLQVPSEMIASLLDRLIFLKRITSIRAGNLPTINSQIRLESDELCHFEVVAVYHKVNAKSVTTTEGRLVATNKKLHFLSSKGGAEIGYKSIKRIDVQSGGIYLELSKKSGNGFYRVDEPLLVEAVLDTLVRISNRELVQTDGEGESRHIPHDVKVAVWQRDHGQCVQCRATSYLEFDHVIPFSKGGANTVGNVQLLCRKCNLAKSDRI